MTTNGPLAAAAPRWPSADAGGDVVSDDHRVSLTYGEAHFCPLYRLLLTAGVRPGDTLRVAKDAAGPDEFLLHVSSGQKLQRPVFRNSLLWPMTVISVSE